MSFQFTPTTGLLDTNTYPASPESETAARQQFMDLFNQTRDYINTSVPIKDDVTAERTYADNTFTKKTDFANAVLSTEFVTSFGENGKFQVKGFLVQWGKITATGSNTGSVNFTSAFPNACYGIQCTISPSGYNAIAVRTSYPANSKTSFAWESLDANGNGTAPGYIFWFAYGHKSDRSHVVL